jgi:KUP system potassium uptake protein
MEANGSHGNHHKLSAAGLIITLGIIYGDIGTSPLYVMRAIVGTSAVNRETIFGAVSLIFWTLTIQTTLKYIMLVLQADNNGEGGIFSLFTLVRRKAKWLVFPAMIGGCSMLAEGMITPPISICTAIEGLEHRFHGVPVIEISIIIISILFFFQRFGTSVMGKFFGPIMLVWFSMLAIIGIYRIAEMPSIVQALSPHYAILMLIHHKSAIVIMGAVFLCTTGAEALYADLGHCGKSNIRASWIFVKTTLVLNYLGQAAWCLTYEGQSLPENPFYGAMPDWFKLTGVFIATLSTIIASQAMISGSFTLVSEAIRLGLLPKLTVVFPSNLKGQLYVPAVNTFLWAGCIGVVLFFKESEKMEAAYGLSVTITMLMSTILLSNFLIIKRTKAAIIWCFLIFYLIFEGCFFAANLFKFKDGGYVTILIASLLFGLMFIWIKAKEIRRRYSDNVPIKEYLDQLIGLSNDTSIPKYATNIAFLSTAKGDKKVEEKIMYSILQTQPKRADNYFFVHVEVTDEPYTMEYKVNAISTNDVYKVIFRLGFRVEQRINVFLKKVVEEMMENGEIEIDAKYHINRESYPTGDFKYVLLQEFLSHENDLPMVEQLVMSAYLTVKGFTASPQNWFGLDSDSVEIEKVPLLLKPVNNLVLKRLK